MLMNEWAGCIYGLLYIRRNKRGVGAGKRLCEHWERGWWELEADVKYDTTLLCVFYEIKVKVANIRQKQNAFNCQSQNATTKQGHVGHPLFHSSK